MDLLPVNIHNALFLAFESVGPAMASTKSILTRTIGDVDAQTLRRSGDSRLGFVVIRLSLGSSPGVPYCMLLRIYTLLHVVAVLLAV